MTIVGPRRNMEADTATCVHCNRAWMTRSNVKGKGDPGGWCMVCMKMICPKCAGKPCMPFLKKLDLYEKRQDLFKKMGLTL
ncbi:hypothetical protein EPN95_04625 [Patescibacteria group bacterium]|nr:MAG: hypothetical protein EPN95_04625 [Patescibacteria group bacterium]